MTIWFATNNPHKKAELAAILSAHTIRVPADAGLAFDPEETGTSFLENALIKARALQALTGEAVLADDSGLCVDALGGRPGVYSARYAGPHPAEGGAERLDAAQRNALLLKELEGVSRRSARFVCAMALVLAADRFFIAQETLEGVVVEAERGHGGFGYDPVLYLPERGCTVAELSEAEKNRISHRALAARALAALLP